MPLQLTDHAIERFVDRWRQGTPLDQAEIELRALAQKATATRRRTLTGDAQIHLIVTDAGERIPVAVRESTIITVLPADSREDPGVVQPDYEALDDSAATVAACRALLADEPPRIERLVDEASQSRERAAISLIMEWRAWKTKVSIEAIKRAHETLGWPFSDRSDPEALYALLSQDKMALSIETRVRNINFHNSSGGPLSLAQLRTSPDDSSFMTHEYRHVRALYETKKIVWVKSSQVSGWAVPEYMGRLKNKSPAPPPVPMAPKENNAKKSARLNAHRVVDAWRLGTDKTLTEKAIQRAHATLGLPYDGSKPALTEPARIIAAQADRDKIDNNKRHNAKLLLKEWRAGTSNASAKALEKAHKLLGLPFVPRTDGAK